MQWLLFIHPERSTTGQWAVIVCNSSKEAENEASRRNIREHSFIVSVEESALSLLGYGKMETAA